MAEFLGFQKVKGVLHSMFGAMEDFNHLFCEAQQRNLERSSYLYTQNLTGVHELIHEIYRMLDEYDERKLRPK
jgi:hypothetical protein